MTTITLKINERTNFGKTFLAFLKNIIAKEKSIEFVNTPNTETLKAMRDIENGKTEKITLTEFRKQLYT